MKNEHESWIDELGLQQIDLKKIDNEDDNLKKFDSQYLELPWNSRLQPHHFAKLYLGPPIHLEGNQKRQAYNSNQTLIHFDEQCI
jgi:hypothetical protein